MDPLSITAAVVGVTGVGMQVALKLTEFAQTVSTAAKNVKRLSDDVYSTCGALNQIRNLLEPRQGSTGQKILIFSAQGLQDLKFSTQSCQAIFEEIEIELKKASKQIEGKKAVAGKVTLTVSERAKWPFLQPNMDRLRADLRDSKLNLQLMLSITTLANAQMLYLEKASSPAPHLERQHVEALILSMQRAPILKKHGKNPEVGAVDSKTGDAAIENNDTNCQKQFLKGNRIGMARRIASKERVSTVYLRSLE